MTPVSTTITFVGAAAVAILARASSSKPFLFFDRSGGYIRKTVTDGPYSYDLEFTLTKA